MLGSPRLHFAILGYSEVYWATLATWLYWAVLGWTRLCRAVPGCTGLCWAVLDCTGLNWVVLGCSGLYLAVLGCTGPHWTLTWLYLVAQTEEEENVK